MLKKTINFTLVLFGVSVVGGLLCVIIPAFVSGVARSYDAPLFPILRTAFENLRFFPTVVSLFFLGCCLGFLRSNHWMFLAIGTVIAFPVISIVEMFMVSSSHNLWPLEFIVYAILGVPSILGGLLGRILRRKLVPAGEKC